MSDPAFLPLLEPAAVDGMGTDREDVPVIAALSTAISLKRIADALEKPKTRQTVSLSADDLHSLRTPR